MAEVPASHSITYRDYGGLKIRSEYQLKGILEMVPIQNLRPEERNEARYVDEERGYPYEDATPSGLRDIKLRKLFWTEVDWRLLTDKAISEFDDNFFSRLVELEKFRLYSKAMELRKIRYNREEEEEQVAQLMPSSVSYASFSRHRLEEIDVDVSIIDRIDNGEDLLASLVEEESSQNFGNDEELSN